MVLVFAECVSVGWPAHVPEKPIGYTREFGFYVRGLLAFSCPTLKPAWIA